MSLSAVIIDYLNRQLSQVLCQNFEIHQVTPVGGGNINSAYCLHTHTGKLMLKTNSKSTYPQMFVREAEGLKAIAATNTIAVPDVILQDDFDDTSILVLGWVDGRRATEKASAEMGLQLAAMHKNSAGYFGFEHNNYMGSLPQGNRKHDNWLGFFIEERLQPMVKMAVDKGLLHKNDVKNFDHLYLKLPHLFNEEAPSLIHGDLWGGNYLIGMDEKPYLIDPAVSYAHRECDIAMTTLFDGFSPTFYDAYNEAFPLQPGWQNRLGLWNLYPLLVHLNLFGLGYLGQVREVMREYS